MKVNFKKMTEITKNNRVLIITVICIILAIILSMVFLSTKGSDYGDNPVKDINENRSQILVTGSNYSMNYEQEEEYIKQEEKRSEIRQDHQEEIKQQTGINGESSGQSGDGKNDGGSNNEKPGDGAGGNGEGSDGDGENAGGEEENSKKPKLECTLTNGQSVNGNYLSFDVRATSYKNMIISAFDMYVTINGTRVTSTGTSARGWVTFKDDGTLVDGTNVIAIKATDQEGYSSNVKYIVNVNLSGERPKSGTAYITLDAPSIGLGVLLNKTIDVYEGENVASVLMRAFDGTSITAEFSGSINHGFYLKRICSPNLLVGWTPDMINSKVKARLDDMNESFSFPDDLNALEEKNLYRWSGWVVAYNGIYGDGMSTQPVHDGDEIRVSFSLHMGNEYNGTWSECCL